MIDHDVDFKNLRNTYFSLQMFYCEQNFEFCLHLSIYLLSYMNRFLNKFNKQEREKRQNEILTLTSA